MNQGRPLIFGEVLFDCFPDGRKVLGGAPFNVAWNLKAFGIQPLFISRIGDDPSGKIITETMASWSMSTEHLQHDKDLPTGRVDILLTNGEPRFTIQPNQAYDNLSTMFSGIAENPAFLYHGSLALREKVNRTALAELKATFPCPVFLDVNLRTPWWTREFVLEMIKDATWLKMNDDESRLLFPDEPSLESCAAMLIDRFNIEAVFITMGSSGAFVLPHNSNRISVKPSAAVEVADTVGAGDAFSSVLLLGLLYNWPLQLCLDRAQEFASAIVGQRGAIIQDRNFYTTIFEKWMQQ